MNWWRKFLSLWRAFIHGDGGEFLCDTCRYDYGNACMRPERPNARKCPDYKQN